MRSRSPSTRAGIPRSQLRIGDPDEPGWVHLPALGSVLGRSEVAHSRMMVPVVVLVFEVADDYRASSRVVQLPFPGQSLRHFSNDRMAVRASGSPE